MILSKKMVLIIGGGSLGLIATFNSVIRQSGRKIICYNPMKHWFLDDYRHSVTFRFLNRIWRLANFSSSQEVPEEINGNLSKLENRIERKLHKTIKKVSEDIERFHFNTAISAIMELINLIYTATFKNSKIYFYLPATAIPLNYCYRLL